MYFLTKNVLQVAYTHDHYVYEMLSLTAFYFKEETFIYSLFSKVLPYSDAFSLTQLVLF